MKKILFVIQSLRIGGAEKELVILSNRLVEEGYDVTIALWLPIFDYQPELDKRVHVRYRPQDQHLGNRIPYIRYKYYDDVMWMLRATPRQLHRYYIGREKYDIEIAFFHDWAVKIVSGTTNRKSMRIAWIHRDFRGLSEKDFSALLRQKDEYARMHKIVCVSEEARKGYIRAFGDTGNLTTIHNYLSISDILKKSAEIPKYPIHKARFHAVLVGRFADQTKGQLRSISAVEKLRGQGYDVSLALVGKGEHEALFRDTVRQKHMETAVSVIDVGTNPYPYIKEADLLICASYTEGYNLTVAEALIIGTPVLSTDCAGPVEILDNGEYGMIVENSEEGLYQGIKTLYDDPRLLEHYRQKTAERRSFFDEETIFKQITDLFKEE